MPIDSPDLIIYQQIRDAKDIRQTEHPIDKLQLLQEFAKRDDKPKMEALIATLLRIIDGLHTRICVLEEKIQIQGAQEQ